MEVMFTKAIITNILLEEFLLEFETAFKKNPNKITIADNNNMILYKPPINTI